MGKSIPKNVVPPTNEVELPVEPEAQTVEPAPAAESPAEPAPAAESPAEPAPVPDLTALLAMMGQMATTVAALAATVESIKSAGSGPTAQTQTQTQSSTQSSTQTDTDTEPEAEAEEEGVQVTWAQVRSLARRLMNFAGNEPLSNWIPGIPKSEKPSTQEGWKTYYQSGADRLTDMGVSRAGLNRAFAALKDAPTSLKARRAMLRGLYEVLGEDYKALPLWGAEAEEAAPASKKGAGKGKEAPSGDEASFQAEVKAKIAAARSKGQHKLAMELLSMLG